MEEQLGVRVRIENGGLGEISVHVDGERVYDGPRLWYPTPSGIVQAVRAARSKAEEPGE